MVPPSRPITPVRGTTPSPDTPPAVGPETVGSPEIRPSTAVRDGSTDAAALARTEATHPEAPGTGMSEGPRLELQQWGTRLGDLTREFEALPAGSAEANAKLAEIRTHLSRLSAIQSRVEESLRSGVGALAQDHLMLLSTSRSALAFVNSHRSDPGTEAYTAESSLVGALQSRRDRSLASLRTLANDRLIPSLGVTEGTEPSEQQITDYRLLGQIRSLLFEASDEDITLPRGMAETYAPHIHPESMAVGTDLPDYMRSRFFRELDPHPTVTGTPPAEGSPDAAAEAALCPTASGMTTIFAAAPRRHRARWTETQKGRPAGRPSRPRAFARLFSSGGARPVRFSCSARRRPPGAAPARGRSGCRGRRCPRGTGSRRRHSPTS